MSSVNSVRIPGLATGMDTDQMIKDMLVGEQSKVDKAKQKEQKTKWQQESYRDIIKSVKGLYDKYFSATSPDFILSTKVFGTTTITSSNSNIISATAGAGANNINYKFKVTETAKPPKLESKVISKDETMEKYITGDSSKITINGKEITINKTDTIKNVVDNINKSFPGSEVKAIYSEMTGKFSIEGNKTGSSSKLSVS
ncbi:flagellar cap protein FliD N-terminal domain-containing protein, partial [Romboutsia sp.]|uniref:flagellar cap protein FliD N-terminal domain-containing protein n=1 Tax=Romboutsia sp. TaxID=1965302 RepID=UPI003F4030F4